MIHNPMRAMREPNVDLFRACASVEYSTFEARSGVHELPDSDVAPGSQCMLTCHVLMQTKAKKRSSESRDRSITPACIIFSGVVACPFGLQVRRV